MTTAYLPDIYSCRPVPFQRIAEKLMHQITGAPAARDAFAGDALRHEGGTCPVSASTSALRGTIDEYAERGLPERPCAGA